MTMRKAGYIKGAADAAINGSLDLSVIAQLPDNEVITQLSRLDGVGVWTAEMLLISSLSRPDIVSWGDLAIRRGMMNLYRHKTLPVSVSSAIAADIPHTEQLPLFIYGRCHTKRWRIDQSRSKPLVLLSNLRSNELTVIFLPHGSISLSPPFTSGNIIVGDSGKITQNPQLSGLISHTNIILSLPVLQSLLEKISHNHISFVSHTA